jgi:hypothetical protein
VPPGFVTRRISRRATTGFGQYSIEPDDHVLSNASSANGSRSASPRTYFTGPRRPNFWNARSIWWTDWSSAWISSTCSNNPSVANPVPAPTSRIRSSGWGSNHSNASARISVFHTSGLIVSYTFERYL